MAVIYLPVSRLAALAAALIFCAMSGFAAPVRFEALTTATGKTYTDVRVVQILKDSILIEHASGSGKVSLDSLSDEQLRRLGLVPDEVHKRLEAAKQQQEAAEAARRAEAQKKAEQLKQKRDEENARVAEQRAQKAPSGPEQ